MPKRLILIRHGDAVGQGEKFIRPLTRAASRSLSAILPRLLQQLDLPTDEAALCVWSSPYACARETATLVGQVVGVSSIEVHESLHDGALNTFGDELIEEFRMGTEVVVAVGHEPFLGHAAEEMGGVWLPFTHGAVAVIRLTGGTVVAGELESFHQGPRVDMWETVVSLETLFRDEAEDIHTLFAAFLAYPSEVSACRELYEALCSLRALTRFMSPYLHKAEFDCTDKALRKLTHTLAELYRYDVLIAALYQKAEGDVTQTGVLSPTAEAITKGRPFAALLEQLLLIREDECARVVHRLTSAKARMLWATTDGALRAVHWCKDIEREGVSALELRQQYVLVEKNFEAHLFTTSPEDVHATRFLRAQARALVALSGMMRTLVGMRTESVGEEANDVEARLRILCEARANRTVLEHLATRDLSAQVRWELGQSIEEFLSVIERAIADMDAAQVPSPSSVIVRLGTGPLTPDGMAND